jgi:hypothetical protein
MDENFLEVAEASTQHKIEIALDRARIRQTKPLGFDGICTCGETIQEERIQLGYYRCLCCQSQLERKGQRS